MKIRYQLIEDDGSEKFGIDLEISNPIEDHQKVKAGMLLDLLIGKVALPPEKILAKNLSVVGEPDCESCQ